MYLFDYDICWVETQTLYFYSFWDDVYGFKMSCMKADVIKEASVGVVKPEVVVTAPACIKARGKPPHPDSMSMGKYTHYTYRM